MPQDKPPLSAEDISVIERWVAAGAKDDTPASAQQRYDQDHPPHYAAAPVVTAVQFSPDGKTLAISGYHEVLLHDVDKLLAGESSLKSRLIGLSERIESVAFSPDGEKLGRRWWFARTSGRSPAVERERRGANVLRTRHVRHVLWRELVARWQADWCWLPR